MGGGNTTQTATEQASERLRVQETVAAAAEMQGWGDPSTLHSLIVVEMWGCCVVQG